jgi:hypothetical protein
MKHDILAFDSPINNWFELSYAQFLTVPRLVMESMPAVWQTQMAALLQEMDDTFDWRPTEGRYWVKLRDRHGRFTDAPLDDYRHGSIEHLRKESDMQKTSQTEVKPICPRCGKPMIKTYIECDDHSGWMCGFTCTCYRPDEEAFAAKEASHEEV